MPVVGTRGWIALVRDKKIHTKPLEVEARIRSRLSTFVFTQRRDPGDLWAWAELVVLRWRDIKDFADTQKRPFIAGVPGRRGAIRRLR
jgi:hypothetical protein